MFKVQREHDLKGDKIMLERLKKSLFEAPVFKEASTTTSSIPLPIEFPRSNQMAGLIEVHEGHIVLTESGKAYGGLVKAQKEKGGADKVKRSFNKQLFNRR